MVAHGADQARRDVFIPELNRLGLHVPVVPDGAFYAWADIREAAARWGLAPGGAQPEDAQSWRFAFELLRRCQIAATPGRDFAQADPGRYLRFSTASSLEQLQEAVARLEAAL